MTPTMPDAPLPPGTAGGPATLNEVEVRCYFVRRRNALLARAGFGPLYEDYYLHWMQHGIRFVRRSDDVLKDTLAALVLHLATRPWDETVAWTLNIQDPLLNVFATGSNPTGTVTGRVWEHGVRSAAHGLFHAQVIAARGEPRLSTVEVSTADPFRAAEAYYARSEQRPARFFRLGPEEFVLASAQPDCDLAWLAALDDAAVGSLDQREELSLLEVRRYAFDCGCTAARMVERLAALQAADRATLFDDGPTLRVDCPRCGAVFEITRELFERCV